MNQRNATQRAKLKRGGVLLLTALMSAAVLAGCGSKKNTPSSNKAKSKQTLNVVPGKNASEKGDKKSDDGKSAPGNSANAKQKQPTTTVSSMAGGQKTSPKKTGNKKTVTNSVSVDKSGPDMTAPVITVHPINALAAPGGSATFSITAKDASMQEYAWKVDKNDGKGWTDIPGANASGYTVSDVTKEQDGWKYRCVVTNKSGTSESREASLLVREPVEEKPDSGGTGPADNTGSAGNAGSTGSADNAAKAGSTDNTGSTDNAGNAGSTANAASSEATGQNGGTATN